MTLTASTATARTKFFSHGSPGQPVLFPSGASLPGFTLAYETYGELDPERSNAVLVFHAMTGSQHAAGRNPSVPGIGDRWTEDCFDGWWDSFVGPGKIFDTDKYFVVCANHLGGCYGSTGPSSIDPRTGKHYGSSFPQLTISDIVESQVLLLDALGVARLRAAAGGSIGGLMVLDLSVRHPERVSLAMPVAAGPALTPLQCLLNFEQITAIESDPDFAGGDYYPGRGPAKGLALARMIAHKTFISLSALESRARREVVQPGERSGNYRLTSNIESYMFHQGKKFVERFDANSYLHVLAAWQTFDLRKSAGAASLADAFARCAGIPFLIHSIDSDVCFYPEEQEALANGLAAAGAKVSLCSVHSDKGHDSFLLEPELYAGSMRAALENPALVGTEGFPC